MVGGRRVRVIDGHAHCIIPVDDIVKGTPLAGMGGGAGNNILGPERLQLMDQQGVDVQALTINGFCTHTMVFSEEGLRHLVAEMGVAQIVYGTDVPFNWPVTVDLVLNAPFLSDRDKVAILNGNLMTLLRVAP
jgi:hypothetical protein